MRALVVTKEEVLNSEIEAIFIRWLKDNPGSLLEITPVLPRSDKQRRFLRVPLSRSSCITKRAQITASQGAGMAEG